MIYVFLHGSNNTSYLQKPLQLTKLFIFFKIGTGEFESWGFFLGKRDLEQEGFALLKAHMNLSQILGSLKRD